MKRDGLMMSRPSFYLRHVVDLLSGRPVFHWNYYRRAVQTRLLNLFAHVDLERWRGLKILEVGAGLGHIGDVFVQLGFDVTSSDGRPEHVEHMRRRGRKAFVLDLDQSGVDEAGDYDLIVAFGVLYHLAHPERLLTSCGRRARVLLLETAVSDVHEPVVPLVSEATGLRGQDQALLGTGCRPSPAWVEDTSRAAGFDVIRDISNGLGNWETGIFDWEPCGSGATRRGRSNLRKMWVMEKSEGAGAVPR